MRNVSTLFLFLLFHNWIVASINKNSACTLCTISKSKPLDQSNLIISDTLINVNNSKVRIINLEYGIGYYQSKELNLIPKVNGGIQNYLMVELTMLDQVYRALSLKVGYAAIGTKIEQDNGDRHESINFQLEVKYNNCFRLLDKKKFDYYIGPNFAYYSSISNYPHWDDSHRYWCTSITLGVFNYFSIPICNNLLWDTTFEFGFFGMVSRPDTYRLIKLEEGSIRSILSKANSNFHFAFINNNCSVKFQSGIVIPLSGKASFGLYYRLFNSSVDCNYSNPLKEIAHSINLRIIL